MSEGELLLGKYIRGNGTFLIASYNVPTLAHVFNMSHGKYMFG
jgi:hypothetical protein